MVAGEWDCAGFSASVFFLEWPSESLWPTVEVQSNYTWLEQNRKARASKLGLAPVIQGPLNLLFKLTCLLL